MEFCYLFQKKLRTIATWRILLKIVFRLFLFDRVIDELPVDKVIVDDYRGAYEATEHMIQKGCRNIVHLAANEKVSVGNATSTWLY